ncbi:MAG TPA: trypsin-like peptidase domain-containing protein [Blastocatellia bacterium]|nr:trypsin-like peptidase domain-containing protein [Blastocatellia bacterium]
MQQDNFSTDQVIERYRRSRQRAVLVAVAACFLAGGVIMGALFSRPPKSVRAGEKEINSELASAFVEISRQVEPTVVNISTVSQPVKSGSNNDFPGSNQSLDLGGSGEGETARRGNGSGVIIDPQGYILTNQHVIQGADRIKIKLYDGNELPARVVGSDRETDLAVVKVDPPAPLTAARMGDSERMRVGDWVLAIGSPFGLDQTVTAGIISAKERQSAELYKKVGFQYFLQTDAAINRGNSGGPLINLSGEVVGINSAIATSTGDYNGVCFALPTSEAMTVYQQLIKQGRVVRGFLGAFTDPVTPQIAKVYGLPVSRGAIVSNISATVEVDGSMVESPAAKAGIKPNDVIVEFQGYKIKDNSDLVRRVASTTVGTTAMVKLYREGRETTLPVVIARRPGRDPVRRSEVTAINAEDSPRNQNIGISIQTSQSARGGSRGVQVMRVDPGSIADDAELKPNDVIEQINREPIRDREDFKRALGQLKSGDSVVLQVYREKLAPFPRIFVSFNKP